MNSAPADKLDMFENAIMRRAGEQCDKILQEYENTRKQQLAVEENRLQTESQEILYKEKFKIKSEISRQTAAEITKLKQQVFEKRAEVFDEITALAEEKIKKFVESSEYQAFLLSSAKKLDLSNQSSGTLILRSADKSFAGQIAEAAGMDKALVQVKTDDDRIILGGFIFISTADMTENDMTLDAALAKEKERLLSSAGLSLQNMEGDGIAK